MLSAEKALYLDLCSGLSVGYQWLGEHDLSISENCIPNTVLLEGRHLAELAALYASGEQSAVQVVEGIVEKASDILKQPVVSVTDKDSGTVLERTHDYVSLAKYWWPDAQQENNLPYVRRDGEVNPECYSERFDNERLVFMAESLQVLSLAAYLTGDAIWTERAIDQLQVWFINPATRQTTHFQYAQIIPGKDVVRSAGTIESRHLIYVTEAIYLLESIHALPFELSRGLRQWFEELLQWMRSSQNGRAADRAKNNIAYWYDLQCLAYAWFVRDQRLAEHIILNRVLVRSVDQIEPDGSLPLELKRANPLDYVVFTLAAMSQISRYGDRLGIPVWRQTDADGRSFQTAHDWLLQQAQVRSGQAAAQQLAGMKTGNATDAASYDLDDLILQMALVNRLAEARGRMVKDRDHWRDIHVKRISELENSLEKIEKNTSEKESNSALGNKKMEHSRLEHLEKERLKWLEKKLIETKDQRIKDLQDQLKIKADNQKIKDKQQELKETIQNQKEKLSNIESRLKSTRHQFEILLNERDNKIRNLQEENAELVKKEKRLSKLESEYSDLVLDKKRLESNEKRFNELLKKNEKELERFVNLFRTGGYSGSDKNTDSQLRLQIKQLKQEYRSELRSQQRKIDRLQQGLDQQKARANYFKERSNKILKSRSWRLTGFFRRVFNPFGRGGQEPGKKN